MDVNNFYFGSSVLVGGGVVVLFVVVVGGVGGCDAEDVCKGTSYICDVWMSHNGTMMMMFFFITIAAMMMHFKNAKMFRFMTTYV